jgi:hypothetical protein
MQAHYFRGFRAQPQPIELDTDLVVVEGRNSSGKTSLAEAFEWLFTGHLSRRSAQHARELASCIGNEFRPAGEKTWVEAMITVDAELWRIRRVLTADYSDVQAATTTSDLHVDGKKIKPNQAVLLLDRLFAGVAPILMQHTLSHFIHGTPDIRRRYFERLLQLDELTGLIEKAVVGDARSAEFVPPVGALSHSRWLLMRGAVSPGSKRLVERFERKAMAPSRATLERLLQDVGTAEFRAGSVVDKPFSEFVADLRSEHTKDRERQFPFLNDLRPRGGTSQFLASTDSLSAIGDAITESLAGLGMAEEAAQDIAVAELAIARAVDCLIAGGLIQAPSPEWSTCPLCEYKSVPTLSSSRVASLHARLPLAVAVDKAKDAVARTAGRVTSESRAVRKQVASVLIPGIDEQTCKPHMSMLDPSVVIGIAALNDSVRSIRDTAAGVIERLEVADGLVASGTRSAELTAAVRAAGAGLVQLRRYLNEYGSQFSDVEKTLGVVALADPRYALREKWLEVVDDLDGVVPAIGWGRAKVKAHPPSANIG